MRHRVRYIGQPDVPVNDELPRIVTFVCAGSADGAIERVRPVGTGFFVGMPAERVPNGTHWYLVTSRHVVAYEPHVFVRVQTNEGLQTVPVNDWVLGESEEIDVAIAPFGIPPGNQHLAYSTQNFYSDADEPPYLGDNVYFVGLLSFIPEMVAANVPMVRSGTLGALYQAGVPVLMPGDILLRVTAHLIDCRAYRGFSGSPCFLQYPNGHTRLLGVVGAHFDARAEVPLKGDLVAGASATVPIHSGVGVIMPIEYVTALLGDERLVTMRSKAEDEVVRQEESEVVPAVADALSAPTLGRDEFFDALGKVSRPKDDNG